MNLYEWRHGMDLTTRELAARMDVRPSTISDLEHGRISFPPNSTIWTLYAALDGIRTEADFQAMAQASKHAAEAYSPKGPGYAFIETAEGCQLVRTIDGKPTPAPQDRSKPI